MRLSKNAKEKANAQGPFEVKTWRGNLQKPGKNLKRAGKKQIMQARGDPKNFSQA